MIDPYTFISDANRRYLGQIQSEIDDAEEIRLLHGFRKLGEQDDRYIVEKSNLGQTLFDIFEYANRPKREVIQYLLKNMPQTLDAILTNTRNKAES